MVPFCQQDPCQQISNKKIYHIAPPPPPKQRDKSITAVLSITYTCSYTSNEVIYYMQAN